LYQCETWIFELPDTVVGEFADEFVLAVDDSGQIGLDVGCRQSELTGSLHEGHDVRRT
jgi:hypothetical protein